MRFTDQQFAMEYDARLERENYPGELYRHVKDGLRGMTRVLDVGAGTGFFRRTARPRWKKNHRDRAIG